MLYRIPLETWLQMRLKIYLTTHNLGLVKKHTDEPHQI